MGLYRNIAGFNDQRVGLSFYNPGTVTLDFIDSGGSSIPSPFADPVTYQEQRDAASDSYETEMNARYDWLMSHSYQEVTAAGYYVTLDNGSIFQWTDKAAGNSIGYLSLDWIQNIENARGTAGALLLHMQEPALAKDTAGYEGGGSSTWYGDPATPTVSDPIPEVSALPPVVPTSDGGVIFDPEVVVTNTYPIPGGTTTDQTTPTAPTTSTPLPVDASTAIKNNLLPLATIAGVLVVAIVGNELLHKRSKPVLVAGVGALFYMMAKK
jgi:hypothetical protein